MDSNETYVKLMTTNSILKRTNSCYIKSGTSGKRPKKIMLDKITIGNNK